MAEFQACACGAASARMPFGVVDAGKSELKVGVSTLPSLSPEEHTKAADQEYEPKELPE